MKALQRVRQAHDAPGSLVALTLQPTQTAIHDHP
jgi:hypothetical protein